MSSRALRSLRALTALSLALAAGACVPLDNVMQTVFGRSMRNQPSFDPYENTRMPADGAVSFVSGNYPSKPGELELGNPDGMGPDVPPFTAADMASGGGPVANLVNPVAPDAKSLARGKVVFERYCGVCHGPQGNPQQSVILPKLQMMMAFPLASGGALIRTDGYIFGMITTGRGVMPPYGHQVTYYDRWNVVNYIRVLQGKIQMPAEAAAAQPAAAPAAGAAGASGGTGAAAAPAQGGR